MARGHPEGHEREIPAGLVALLVPSAGPRCRIQRSSHADYHTAILRVTQILRAAQLSNWHPTAMRGKVATGATLIDTSTSTCLNDNGRSLATAVPRSSTAHSPHIHRAAPQRAPRRRKH